MFDWIKESENVINILLHPRRIHRYKTKPSNNITIVYQHDLIPPKLLRVYLNQLPEVLSDNHWLILPPTTPLNAVRFSGLLLGESATPPSAFAAPG
jgi:hypothetical protein